MRAFAFVSLVILGACAVEPASEGVPPVPVRLSGAVEKGPFLLGSSVSVTPAGEVLTALAEVTEASAALGDGPASERANGRVWRAETRNDLGQFEIEVEYQGFVAVEAVGYYYNEATGDLSSSPLTLRAFGRVSAEDSAVNVNLLTHLTYQRVQTLVDTGMDSAAAVVQAESELHAALGIGAPVAQAADLRLAAGNSDDAAYLFAVSTLFAQSAKLEGGAIDAKLQELLNTTAAHFAAEGTVSAELTAKLEQARLATHNGQVMSELAARLQATGSTAEVPDLDRVIPWTVPESVTQCAENALPSLSLECRLAVCGVDERPSTDSLRREMIAIQSMVAACDSGCWADMQCALDSCLITTQSGTRYLDESCAADCDVGTPFPGGGGPVSIGLAQHVLRSAPNGECDAR